VTRLALPSVTLCAAASVNVEATIAALRFSLERADFAECLLFTDRADDPRDDRIRIIPIAKLQSAEAYSKFVLTELADHIRTEHCLITQWDGFVTDARAWQDKFLSYDYIGAPWPHFRDGRDVGNGGFSLRSKRLLLACRDPAFQVDHPEDIAICRLNRTLLEEEHGILFAPRDEAERFAFERSVPTGNTFGFHGIFNMVDIVGADRFWEIYRSLDDPRTAFVDYASLMRQLGGGKNATGRRLQMTLDLLRALFGGVR